MRDDSLGAIALLALMGLRGVGRRGALRIAEAPPEAGESAAYRDRILENAEKARLSVADLRDAWDRATEKVTASEEAGHAVLSVYDKRYPIRLSKIGDPPAVLFAKGDLNVLEADRLVAVVGTREPTAFGEKVARRTGRTAAEVGFVVVSGLAHGCDTLAHEGCLDTHGIGVAVMAHGLDKVYPAANRGLAERLLAGGGCLVSEYAIGATPMRTAFAERDRIQSGLSDGVFVVETDVKGGTMHTVRFAREQGRGLACVEHPERLRSEDKTKGNQVLIADKWAYPVPDGEALLGFLRTLHSPAGDALPEPSAAPPKIADAQQAWAF